MRHLRASLVALLLLASYGTLPGLADAQALPTATGPGAALVVGVGATTYHIDYGQRWVGGSNAWIDYNPLLHLGVEGETRQLNRNKDLGTHATTLLAGPRVFLLRGGIEPFVKVLAGSGHFVFPYNYARGNYLVVAAGGGIDVHLGGRVQVRVIDVEYQRWPKFTFGDMASYGVSVGISYTVHKGKTWRSP